MSIVLNVVNNKVLNEYKVKEKVDTVKLKQLINSNVLQDMDWDGFKHEKN
jgi:hypothetical protein